jgi:cysteine-rich repeat protein
VCGNGVVEPGETCDDGNTVNGDACPANCRIESCTPVLGSSRTFSVTYAASGDIAGIKVLVDYPEGQVSIPGSGNDSSVRMHITNVPSGAFSTPNDLDYALREVVASASALPPGRLFTIDFQDCQGASAPAPGDFTCMVEDATDPFGNTVTGVSCAIESP